VDELADSISPSRISKAWESASGMFDYVPKEVRVSLNMKGREEEVPEVLLCLSINRSKPCGKALSLRRKQRVSRRSM